MNLDFSSIHEDNNKKSLKPKIRAPSIMSRPMIPSFNNSIKRNSFTPNLPSLSNTNVISLNNTRISNQIIRELDRQSRIISNTVTKKNPTRYKAKELRFKKTK